MNYRGKGFAVLAGGAALSVALLTGAVASAAATTASPRAAAGTAAEVLLSRGKPVVASSSGGCCIAPNAVDGDTTTRWASAAGIDPSWIYVDLGQSATISRVQLQWDASCATAYQVETSADHNTWTSVFATTTGDGGIDNLPVTGSGRYVRVYGTHRCRTDASKGYSLRELEVYGSIGEGQPPTPPGTPTLVSVAPNSATISWTASTDDVGVVAYDIYRDGQSCATTSANILTATCSGLSPKQTYGFYVKARDGAGNVSPPSGTLQVTTPPSSDDQKPTAPANLHTTAPPTSTSVALAWTAATDNVGVVGYNIYDGTDKIGTSTTTSTTLEGLTPGQTYHLTVTAFDANSNEGPASNALPVTLPSGGPCNQPICKVDQIGTDNDVVWGLVTLPDGSILYNRRDAHYMVRLVPSTGTKSTGGTVPNVQSTDGEGGLTGLAISPSFATDRWLYIMHTSPSDNRIVRIKLTTDNKLDTSSEQVLVTGIARSKFHNGGRLRWGPDGKLYAGTGDAENKANAPNKNSLNGKVLRINPDGTVPSDNPFGNYVWSYGHRNVQGLAFDSQGRLWEQEFGNSIMDETNLIEKGGNYGWPSCEGTSGSCGSSIPPKATYPVAAGSCSGITIVRDYLYVACQRGTRLYRFRISGSSLTDKQQFFQGTYGRLRTVEPAPDGGLWLATSNGGDKDSTPNNSNNRIFHLTLGA